MISGVGFASAKTAGHARRVGHRKIGARLQWRLVFGFDFAAEM
jgi:hypothetical protein